MELSVEQKEFIEKVKEGKNVLVDACIGSGKTTAIQHLCDELPNDKKILYLTYNKLLKIDAKAKIKNKNVLVTNYHGLAYMCLKRLNISCGISDMIQSFNRARPRVFYDILVIDEYQDIEEELATMLDIIKENNPNMQLVAVGDMKQKIYDKTTLDVESFIDKFLGEHDIMEFTQCFRLSKEHAAHLGNLWEKKIIGVNKNCKISFASTKEIVPFLKDQNPSDVICLGARTGDMANTLNTLEKKYPYKYNKNTVFASISDGDRASEPKADSGIFTTFDSSKGMERKICVVFDWTESYWMVRIRQPQQSYQILKNIFLVAASRGKEQIIFVYKDHQNELLSDRSISTDSTEGNLFNDVDISQMFDFKYKEDIERCFSLLTTKKIEDEDNSEIEIVNRDGLIDLSPCIGIYQEARFFTNYDIDKAIRLQEDLYASKREKIREMFGEAPSEKAETEDEAEEGDKPKKRSLERKILYLTSLHTHQNRYRYQVRIPFVSKGEDKAIVDRLYTEFTPDEVVQKHCEIEFESIYGKRLFTAKGICDVIKNNIIYELKFTSELQHEHFLQCACYMIALGNKKGILWNIRTNTKYEISIPDRKAFLNAVTVAVTKGKVREYNGPYTYVLEEEKKEKKRATQDRFKAPECLVPGEIIEHKIFGEGYVENISGDIVSLVFKKGTMKFSYKFLRENNLIRAAV